MKKQNSKAKKSPLRGSTRTLDISPLRSQEVKTTSAAAAAAAEGPSKTIYLIRHGESLGQKASRKRRSHDTELTDCALSHQGEFQATVLPSLLGSERYGKIDYVISSPLTRAVQTSVLGFPSKPIVIHYDLHEIGGRESNIPIPENRPRHLKEVIADTGGIERIDGTTFAPRPTGFPKSHEKLSKKDRKERIRRVWPNLWRFCQERACEDIAVVCHHNIIRMALTNDSFIQPENAVPIECRLYQSGRLEVVGVLVNPVEELSVALAEIKERNKSLMEIDSADTQEYDDEGYVVFE